MGVVVRGHDEAVGTCAEDGEEVARPNFREGAVLAEVVACLADGPDYVRRPGGCRGALFSLGSRGRDRPDSAQ